MKVLVTGGMGYVGSHIVRELIRRKHNVETLDLPGKTHQPDWKVDIVGSGSDVWPSAHYDCVIHAAALVSVGESVSDPGQYTRVNVIGTQNVVNRIRHGHFIHISTVTANDPQNPYALSKRLAEYVVETSCNTWSIARLSNVAGALPGLKQTGPVTHLIRSAARAVIDGTTLKIYGNDYPTPDGTSIRDYIHVADVADAIANMCDSVSTGYHNVCSGEMYSCLDVLKTMGSLKYEINQRRPGDPDYVSSITPSSVCPLKKRSLIEMCESALESERTS